MQVLKDEVRNNILTAAKKLFYQKGYNNASIRDIAKNSGITVGNVYRYFENKESVLEGVVSPVYEKIMDYIALSESYIKAGENKSFEDFRNEINSYILQITKEFRLELLILFKGTQGTRFEKTRSELISLIENRIYEGLFKRLSMEDDEAAFFSKIVARSFLESLIMVIAETEDNRKLKKMIYRLNDFYFNHLNSRFDPED
ncbi:MAG: TetR/AcrR family transcriptional regulator [Clostridiaceae bacterium]|nr:TetR/AcrR family transcriptional regulator [Clostridiaceae bacterium]